MAFYESIKYGSERVAFEVEAPGNQWYRKPLEAGNRLINCLYQGVQKQASDRQPRRAAFWKAQSA